MDESPATDVREVFTVKVGSKSVQVQSDRPLIRSIPNSKKKPNYKAVNATVEQKEFFEIVIAAIQAHTRSIEHPPYDWSQHPKNVK